MYSHRKRIFFRFVFYSWIQHVHLKILCSKSITMLQKKQEGYIYSLCAEVRFLLNLSVRKLAYKYLVNFLTHAKPIGNQASTKLSM